MGPIFKRFFAVSRTKLWQLFAATCIGGVFAFSAGSKSELHELDLWAWAAGGAALGFAGGFLLLRVDAAREARDRRGQQRLTMRERALGCCVTFGFILAGFSLLCAVLIGVVRSVEFLRGLGGWHGAASAVAAISLPAKIALACMALLALYVILMLAISGGTTRKAAARLVCARVAGLPELCSTDVSTWDTDVDDLLVYVDTGATRAVIGELPRLAQAAREFIAASPEHAEVNALIGGSAALVPCAIMVRFAPGTPATTAPDRPPLVALMMSHDDDPAARRFNVEFDVHRRAATCWLE